jgi:hypothetical protein
LLRDRGGLVAKVKQKRPPFATVYTVSSIDDKRDDPMAFDVIGSYVSRGDAIRECANYILERMELRPDIRVAVYLDENHKDLKKKLSENFELEWVERVLTYDDNEFSWDDDVGRKDLRKFLFDYMVDELGGQSCYYIYSELGDEGPCKFNFDVSENDVEGKLDGWTCITSGDSDDHDEEFEHPFPEVFLSEKEAVKCAIDYLKGCGCLNDADPKYIKDILKEARASFRRYGKYSYTLNDSKVRRWDIWYTPILLSGKIPQAALSHRKKGKD